MSGEIEIRKVQALTGERSLLLVLPHVFSEKLRIKKGDYLVVWINQDKLIVKKADVDDL